MKTDYNRIKVADLEKNDPDKILITNQNGELEFSELNNIQKDNYNALDYTSEGKALDARQGKVLKELIDNISSETTTAIEKSTIIDNDKIIINDSETSFSKKSVKFLNVKAALKTYFDTIYQSFMGVVTVSGISYQLLLSDNAKKIMFTSARAVSLTIPTDAVVALPIGAKIKITQQGDGIVILSTTGLTIVSSSPLYTIKGQTITLEKAAVNTWTIEGNNLNGEVRLPAYPNTRNDGQINNNKVLGTDANGNLRMFTIATNPAPYLDELITDSHLPNSTANFVLKGSFFTPTMTVTLEGQTINYIKFKSDNEVHLNVTTGNVEGTFSVTLNNGISATFSNALLILVGVEYTPVESDYSEKINPPTFKAGELLINSINVFHDCTLDFIIPKNKDFRFQYTPVRSPLHPFGEADYYGNNGSIFYIKDLTLGLDRFNLIPRVYGKNPETGGNGGNDLINSGFQYGGFTLNNTHTFERKNGIFKWYVNGVFASVYSYTSQNSLQFRFRLKNIDLKNIKYIELAT